MAATPETPTPDALAASPAPRGGLTRRAVVRTAAWSVPAITVVAAAPAYASSGGADLVGFDMLATYTLDEDRQRQGVSILVALGVRADPDEGSSGQPSPAMELLFSFTDVWEGTELTYTPTALDPDQWRIVDDSTTTVNPDGSARSSNGELRVEHLGGLLSEDNAPSLISFTVNGPEGLKGGEISGSFVARIVTPLTAPWTNALPSGVATQISTPTDDD